MQNYFNPVIPRVSMVKHYPRQAIGSQHAINFAHRTFCVGSVMQDTIRIDDVETLRRKWQTFTVADRKFTLLLVQLKMLARDLN